MFMCLTCLKCLVFVVISCTFIRSQSISGAWMSPRGLDLSTPGGCRLATAIRSAAQHNSITGNKADDPSARHQDPKGKILHIWTTVRDVSFLCSRRSLLSSLSVHLDARYVRKRCTITPNHVPMPLPNSSKEKHKSVAGDVIIIILEIIKRLDMSRPDNSAHSRLILNEFHHNCTILKPSLRNGLVQN